MNVLIIKNPLESRLGGGGERHTYELAKYLKKCGHGVFYAGCCPYTERLLRELDIKCTAFGKLGEEATSELAIAKFFLHKRFYKKRLYNLIKEFKAKQSIDVAYVISFNEKLLWDKEISSLGVRMVGVEHRLMERQFRLNPLKKLYIKNSEHMRIIGVSRAVKEYFEAGGLPEGRMKVIYNGIDPSLFAPKESYETDSVTIGTISRLSADKGLDRLIGAAKFLVPKYRSLRIAIVGDGEMRASLQDMIEREGLNENVKLMGFMAYEKIPEFLSGVDIFTLTPMRGESFGLVLAEAGAKGLPAVAHNVGGVAEVIAHEETGFVVAPDRPDEFNSRLEALVNSTELREKLGRAARERVESMFTLDRMLREYEEVLLSQ